MQVVHQSRPVVPREKFLRRPAVSDLCTIGKSDLYQRMKDGRFPKSIKLGGRTVVWIESEVLQWVQDRIKEASAKNDKASSPSSTGAAS